MTSFARALLSLSGLALVASGSAAAQAPAPETPRAGRYFAMRGEASLFSEAYTISGREARRPGATARLVFQPTVELTRFLKVGLDFQLTTEGTGTGTSSDSPLLRARRQRLDQIGVSPTWSWGRVDLGDFTDTYSPYTFNGIRVRGAGATVNPGLLRLATFRGQTQTAILGEATNTSYARTVAGGRVGVGRANGSFLDLIFVRANDDAGSLPPPDDTAYVDPRLDDPTVDRDTLAVGTLLNPLSVTPQENVVAGAAGRLVLFQQRLTLHGELTGAAYTRDVRASVLDNEAILDEIPGALRRLFTPRIGSTFGAAYVGAVDVRLGSFAGTASYRRLDPGYVALGVASLMNDQGAWELSGTQRFGRTTSLRFDAARQHDNLLGQKEFTTLRSRYGGMLTLRPLQRWTTSVRLQYVGMHNDLAASEPQWIAYENWMLTSNQTVMLGRDRLLRSVGLGYTYRTSGDDNPARAASSLSAHHATFRMVLAPSKAVSVTPSVGLLGSSSATEAGAPRHWRETYGLAAQLRALEGRWSSSLSVGSTEDRGIGALQARATSRYDLSAADALTFSLRGSRYKNAPNAFGAPGNFREFTASLQLTHRLGNGNGS